MVTTWRRRRAVLGAAVTLAALVLGLPPAAGASPAHAAPLRATGGPLLERAAAVLRSARCVEIRGSESEDGQSLSVDLVVFAAGTATGTYSPRGEHARIIVADGVDYFRADTLFWERQGLSPALAARIGTEWASSPDDGALGVDSHSNAALGLGLQVLVGQILAASRIASLNGTVTDGSARAWRVTTGGQGFIDVADGPTPYPLALHVVTSIGLGLDVHTRTKDLTFSNWNEGVPPSPPAHFTRLARLTAI